MQHSSAQPPGSDVFKDVGSKLRITGMKVFGVTLDEKIARADRPYVFVKLETNQGVVKSVRLLEQSSLRRNVENFSYCLRNACLK